MSVIFTIFSLLLIVLLAYEIWSKFSLNPGYCPIVAMSVITIMMYVFGLNQQLRAGAIIVSLIIVLNVFAVLKNSKQKINQFFSNPGIWFFICLSLLFIFYFHTSAITFDLWDEISHWGPFYKFTFYSRNFPVFYDSNVMHAYYLQGATSLYFFFAWWMSAFSESLPYIVINMLVAAGLAPLFARIKLHNKSLLFWLMIITLVSMSFLQTVFPYFSIYVDFLLGIIFGAGVIMVLDRENHKHILLMGSVILLPSILKDIGLVFSLFLLGILVIQIMTDKKTTYKTGILGLVSSVLVQIVLLRIYWSAILEAYDIRSLLQFSPEKISAAFWGLVSQKNAFFIEVTRSYFRAFMGLQPLIIVHFRISILVIFIFLLVLGIALALIDKQRTKMTKLTLTLGFPVLFILYELILILIITSTFSIYDAQLAPSFDRVTTTVIVGWWMVLLFWMMSLLKLRFNRRETLMIHIGGCVGFMLFIAVVTNKGYDSFFNMRRATHSQQQRVEVKLAWERYKNVFRPHDRVWIISQHDYGFRFWLYHLEFMPEIQVLGGYIPYKEFDSVPFTSWSLGRPKFEGDVWSTPTSLDDFINVLKIFRINYVLIDKADEELYTGYHQLFTDDLTSMGDKSTQVYRFDPRIMKLISVRP